MIARFLQDIVVNDIEKNMEMTIDKGEELFAIDRGTWLLDPRAPKAEMPPELKERIARMKKEAKIDDGE